MSDPNPTSASRVLSPSQLNALARSLLEDSFPLVEVQGEISNLARPGSGHIYLSLKDRNAQVRCALFKPKSQRLAFKPADGQLVLVRGRVTLYEPRGDYQLVLEHMQPAGEGLLQRAFEELKQKLRLEGLFEPERKQAIPEHIHRLGVLTSASGAAIHDVLSVLRRRFPLIEVEILPIPVQGVDCPPRAIDMLARADRSGRYQVLLLTRGGGSLEDLSAFNDEGLARAIAACRTPVVSAIGHEVDFSIADFVADLRCPTPSAAAEALVPDQRSLRQALQLRHAGLQQHMQRRLRQDAQRLDQLQTRLQSQQPSLQLGRQRARASDLQQRLINNLRLRLAQTRQHSQQLGGRLRAQHPAAAILRHRQLTQRLRILLQGRMTSSLQSATRAVSHLGRTLHAISPLATLDRGYAILRTGPQLVRSVAEVSEGQSLQAQLKDGQLQLQVLASEVHSPTS